MTSIVHMAVIGTAGRKEDAFKMNASVFEKMVMHAKHTQQKTWKLPNNKVILVSGGAAWADHVAVKLFLQGKEDGNPYAGLYIYFPCKLDFNQSDSSSLSSSSSSSSKTFSDNKSEVVSIRALDNGSWKWIENPGRIVNQLHDVFSNALGYHTMNDFVLAQTFGAQLHADNNDGFHARNKLVAQRSEYVLAFTWGESTSVPKDGGTLHTWNLCKKKQRIHVPLKQLISTLSSTSPLSTSSSTSSSSSTSPLSTSSTSSSSSSSSVSTSSTSSEIVTDQKLSSQQQQQLLRQQQSLISSWIKKRKREGIL